MGMDRDALLAGSAVDPSSSNPYQATSGAHQESHESPVRSSDSDVNRSSLLSGATSVGKHDSDGEAADDDHAEASTPASRLP